MILRCEDPSFHWAASIKSIYSTKPHHINIAELVSKTQPATSGHPSTLYIQITAHSPETLNGAIIEPAFHQLCTELQAQGSISVVNYPQHEEKDGE